MYMCMQHTESWQLCLPTITCMQLKGCWQHTYKHLLVAHGILAMEPLQPLLCWDLNVLRPSLTLLARSILHNVCICMLHV
ncbi:hypothetical protein DUNSADRAFT_5544 [Dunaliella salina]|uniref:Uncharacterized protein n=1 Tax=Dunaliella salina TaxID=3046 RepID=A0ABQ7FUF8_DUNSA|nr:hypothetical protein DUNSADRAFT_5544 [Dunaliella salina]|eukprot:KAF5836717.1 hypothetical protein DUNSADRAFT_5544 [Dunaliella salina]